MQTIVEGIICAIGMFHLRVDSDDSYLSSTTAHQEAYTLTLLYWKLVLMQASTFKGMVSAIY